MNHKLSVKLAIRTFVLLVCLGLLMALLQTLFDFNQRRNEVEDTITSIVASTQASASNAVFMLDETMASQVIDGLQSFDFFESVTIIDDSKNVLAEFKREKSEADQHSVFSDAILSLFTEHLSKSSIPLTRITASGGTPQVYGEMVFVIDNFTSLSGVYDRAMRAFTIALGGYFLLTLALSILYHWALTSPLTRLSTAFKRVNIRSIASQKISHLKGHETNEFSSIVDSANDMLSRISAGQKLLSDRSQRFRIILDTAPSLIYSINSNLDFVFANRSTALFYGYSVYELKGKNIIDVIQPIDEKLVKSIKQFCGSTKRQLNNVVPIINANGAERFMEMSLVKYSTPDGECILVTSSDVSKRVKAEEKIESLAYYDSLTSLPNRNKVYEILQDAIKKRDGIYGIAAIADLDEFKRINDTLSHSIGDQIIMKLAARLKEEFAFSDLIARLGADEFLCIEENVSDSRESATKAAQKLGERLRNCISKNLMVGSNSYNLTASVGVVVFKPGSSSADEVLQFGDTAMYESKRAGRNKVTLFEDSMATRAAQLMQLERDIIKAIFKNEFFFVLQPIVHSSSHELHGAEALIRWKKGNKTIQPDSFIPFLEDSGLIVEVGENILDDICAYIANAQKRKMLTASFKFAVNISVKQLAQQGFIEQVSKILVKHKVAGERLEFEITESVALNNMEDTINKIETLKSMGICFSLDDFGTGYSSLSYLKDLPVDKVKIDRSFINDIKVDTQDENLVRSIILLSRNLGFDTVAEGVETQAQVEWLTQNGDLFLQGYHFSRPLAVDDYHLALKKGFKEGL